MRITAGKYKNKPIYTGLKADDNKYRPTTERTRAAIFNIINHSKHIEEDILKNAVVADICCGSGAFGMEAISRGAGKVYFIDKDPAQTKLAKKNIASIKEEQNSIFLSLDATALTIMPDKINIVFIDAPYNLNITGKIVYSLMDRVKLDEKHVIIIEMGERENFLIPQNLEVFEERYYGRSKVLFAKMIEFK